MDALLTVDNLHITFNSGIRTIVPVEDISFHVDTGETLGLVGESGCGKSVTALSVMRLNSEHNSKVEGSIRFDGREILSLSEKEMQGIRGNQISMIFQEPMTSLNPLYTIGNQLSEVARLHLGMNKQEALKYSIEMLGKVNIPRPEEIVKDYPHALSGGMQQRVMIAMALACNPKLLIADEPTTALDVTIQAQILNLMKDLQQKYRMAMILITHDLGVVADMADRIAIVYSGVIMEEADIYTIFDKPLHPYTLGLINSIPKVKKGQTRLDSIPGNVPSIYHMKKGCRFADRCSAKREICVQKAPPLTLVDDAHKVRCWKVDPDKEYWNE